MAPGRCNGPGSTCLLPQGSHKCLRLRRGQGSAPLAVGRAGAFGPAGDQ